MKLQPFVRPLLMVGCVLALLAAAPEAAKGPKLLRYQDNVNGFSFDRPEKWDLAQTPPGQTAVAFLEPKTGPNDKVRETVAFVVRKLPADFADIKFDEVMESVKAGIKKQMPGVSFLEEGPAKLGDREAYRMVYAAKVKDVDMKFVQVVSVKEATMYAMTCSSTPADLPKYQDTFEKILASFRFE